MGPKTSVIILAIFRLACFCRKWEWMVMTSRIHPAVFCTFVGCGPKQQLQTLSNMHSPSVEWSTWCLLRKRVKWVLLRLTLFPKVNYKLRFLTIEYLYWFSGSAVHISYTVVCDGKEYLASWKIVQRSLWIDLKACCKATFAVVDCLV